MQSGNPDANLAILRRLGQTRVPRGVIRDALCDGGNIFSKKVKSGNPEPDLAVLGRFGVPKVPVGVVWDAGSPGDVFRVPRVTSGIPGHLGCK